MSFIWEIPEEINLDLASRVSMLRKRRSITQSQLCEKSNVSLSAIKRFESYGQTSLLNLTKICLVLECVDEIKSLFSKVEYNSIDEVIREKRLAERLKRVPIESFEYIICDSASERIYTEAITFIENTLGYKPLSDGSRDDDGNIRILFRRGRSRIVLVKDITRNNVTLFADQALAQSGLPMNARNAKEERRARVRRCLGILLNEIREPNEVLVEALNDYIEGRSNIEELESKLENKE